MLLINYTATTYDFEKLKMKGSFVKFVGSFDELNDSYDILIQKNRLLTVAIGYILEYRLSDFINSAYGKDGGKNEKILKNVDVELHDDFSGVNLISEDMEASLFITKLDSGEIFVRAGDFKTDVVKDTVTMIAAGLRKCMEVGVSEETPVIIQCYTSKGVQGIRKTVGEPRLNQFFAEMLNVDSKLNISEKDFAKIEDKHIITDKVEVSQVSGYAESIQNVIMCKEFSLMNPRGERHLKNLEKILAGEELTEEESKDLEFYFKNINSVLVKTGRDPLTITHIMDRIQMGEADEKTTDEEIADEEASAIYNDYNLVVFDGKSDLSEAFSNLYPENSDLSKYALCFGAVNGMNQAVGVLAVAIEEAFFTIEWIFVEPELRREGIATFLIKGFLNFASESASFREIECQIYDDNVALLEFFNDLPYFDVEYDCDEVSVNWEKIKENSRLKLMAAESALNSPAEMFIEQKPELQLGFFNKIREEKYFNVLENTGFLESMIPELSLCLVKNDAIESAVFFRESAEEEIELQFIYCQNEQDVMKILGKAFKVFLDKYEGYSVKATLTNAASEKMLKKLFGESILLRKRYLAVWNYL